MGKKAGRDWVREEPDGLVAGLPRMLRAMTTWRDSQLEMTRTHRKRPSGDPSEVEVKPFGGQTREGTGLVQGSRARPRAHYQHLLF